ncbi:hypothetical protein [Paenibacillus harenae]|uniref:hypothetical protein n=1 Tax=Paenibacillus harenae TaxID=306543 RepID=UPI000413FEB2|nr:hypothetical protein [Paenibacillus harenae]
MGYKEVHAKWLEAHMRRRTGERRSRLERGHGHGERMFLEQVWWSIFGHMDNLHPEYEVSDWRGRPYFVDFVWVLGRYKFAIEVKGYGPHVQNMDRIRYRQELNRETYLQIAGYRVVAVPYDEIEEKPELVISLLKSLFAPYMASSLEEGKYKRLELDVLRAAKRRNKHIRPIDLVDELKINLRTARRCLQSLCDKEKLLPIRSGKSGRVCRYEFVHSFEDDHLW